MNTIIRFVFQILGFLLLVLISIPVCLIATIIGMVMGGIGGGVVALMLIVGFLIKIGTSLLKANFQKKKPIKEKVSD